VKSNLAAAFTTVSEIDVYWLSTTTLSVLDDSALLLAGGDLLASGAICHTVMELEIAVKCYGNLHFWHWEFRLRTWERSRLVVGHSSLGTFALERPLGDRITPGEAVGAGKAREGKAPILGEATHSKAAPIEAALLLVRALIVGVRGAIEAWSVNVPTCSDLLGSQAGKEDSRGEPHGGKYQRMIMYSEKGKLMLNDRR
jgi:hypothetical protein